MLDHRLQISARTAVEAQTFGLNQCAQSAEQFIAELVGRAVRRRRLPGQGLDEGEQVLHAMAEFTKQEVLVRVSGALVGGIADGQQNGMTAPVRLEQRACCQQHGPAAQAGELVNHFEIDDCCGSGYYL